MNGTNFLNNSVVQFNSAALAHYVVSSTQLQATVPAAQITFAGVAKVTVANPAASGGSSGSSSFLIGKPDRWKHSCGVQPAVQRHSLGPLRQVIYLTVPATAANGNSVAVFDLATGTVIGSQFAGSNPNLLAISGDNQFLSSRLTELWECNASIWRASSLTLNFLWEAHPFSGSTSSRLTCSLRPGSRIQLRFQPQTMEA